MKHISWNVTFECNLFCKHCYRDSGTGKKLKNELNTQEGKELIGGIEEAGFDLLIFSGGEPLLRQDIFELMEYAASLGVIPALGTNGTLVTKEVAEKIKDSGVKSVAVSLDHIAPEKHDYFRGRKGCFQESLRGIENCLGAGLKVQLNYTVTKLNNKEIPEFIDFASRLGAKACHVLFLVEIGRGKEIPEESLSIEEYKQGIKDLLSNKHPEVFVKPTCAPQAIVEAFNMGMPLRASRGCIAGVSYCCVLANGDVHICPYAPVKAGNVRAEPFGRIWRESDIFKKLRDFHNYKGRCHKCAYVDICGGCRARAFSATGDYLETDPYCLLGIHGK